MNVPSPIRVGIRELRSDLTRYLDVVRRGGSVSVVESGIVIAEIRPPTEQVPRSRVPGALKGRIWMAEDFDTWPRGFFDW